MQFTLNVNGKSETVDVEPETPLLWVLRDNIGLTGTKYGCGIARCGVCTIHVDGQAMKACQLPPRTCDPVSSTTTCGSSLLACYVSDSGKTYCDCPGFAGDTEPCGVFSSCVPGYRCVQQGAMTPRCRKVCRLGESDCPAGSTCLMSPGDPMFGYCNP